MDVLKLRIINLNNGAINYNQKEIYRLLYNYNCNPDFFSLGPYRYEQLTEVGANGYEIYKEIKIYKNNSN